MAKTLHDPALKGSIRSLRLLWDYVAPYRKNLFIAAAALLVNITILLSIGTVLKFMIDEGMAQENPATLDRYFTFFLGVVLLLAVSSYVRMTRSLTVSEYMIAAIREDVYRRIVHLDVGFFEHTRTGELVSRLAADTTLLHSTLNGSFAFALRNAIVAIGGSALLLSSSAQMTGVASLIIPVVLVPVLLLARHVRKLSRASQDRVADMSAHAEETISGIRTIQSLSLETYETGRFTALVHQAREAGLRRIRSKALMVALVIGLIFAAIVVVLWMGSRHIISADMTAGEFSSFIFYAVMVASSLGALSEQIGELQQAGGATERLMELRQLSPKITAPDVPQSLTPPVQGRISFYNVLFHYPTRPDAPAADHLSFTIQPGETVALVGPSGAGKTTVFSLLLRFYDPESGKITIDGTDIRDLSPQDFRRHIGFVPQDPVIFSANAWDNIRCGNPEASFKDILSAAADAAALEFLETLPDGLDTHLGEKGVTLSGGQRQRIAIARAMVRNPRILLLDEATSALDSENERKVQEATHRLMQGRTTLVIAHRLSTVKNASRIIVMDKGKVQAIGKHEELMTTSPIYQRLATLQLTA